MTSAAHDAARLLWTCRQNGTVMSHLPDALRPRDAAGAHAIQAALPLGSVVGWKIAATSAAGQAHIQVDGPLAGRILDGFVHPIGSVLCLRGNHMRVVELADVGRFDAIEIAVSTRAGEDQVKATRGPHDDRPPQKRSAGSAGP